MVAVKHINKRDEIPDGERYVLVTYGQDLAEMTEGAGRVFTVPRNAMSDLSFTAVTHAAKEAAKRERLSFVYACK